MCSSLKMGYVNLYDQRFWRPSLFYNPVLDPTRAMNDVSHFLWFLVPYLASLSES